MSLDSKKNKDKNIKLIPLRILAVDGPYKISYLSNLVQRKKLKAEKIGRNYFTTKEWFNDYLKNHSIKKEKIDREENKIVKRKLKKNNEKIDNFNIEELSEKIAEKILNQKKEEEKKVPYKEELKFKKKFFLKEKFFLMNWKKKVISFMVFSFFISLFFSSFFSTASFHFSRIIDGVYLYPLSTILDIENNKNFDSNHDVSFKEGEGYVAGASEKNSYNFFSIMDHKKLTDDMWQSFLYFKDSFKKIIVFLNLKYNNIYLACSDFFHGDIANQNKKENSGLSVDESLKKQGAVVIPYTDDQNAQEIKQKIEAMFSDDVIIQPNENARSGIIKPVFGSDNSDQKYLYMMVPVSEE